MIYPITLGGSSITVIYPYNTGMVSITVIYPITLGWVSITVIYPYNTGVGQYNSDIPLYYWSEVSKQ